MHTKEVPNIADEPNTLADVGPRLRRYAAIVGGVALALALISGLFIGDGGKYLLHSYLTSYCFFLSLSLGGLFFVAVQHASRAGWSVSVRRIAEILGGNLPLMALLALPILVPVLLGNGHLYPWVDRAYLDAHPVVAQKTAWLNGWSFAGRCAVYFAIWALMARFFLNGSTKQDEQGGTELTLRMERWSPLALILFALTITCASVDLVMSLSPEWFSTIFGVYYFSGSTVGALATIIVVACLLQRAGRLTHAITVEHYHELGKLLFAFVVFWGYIAFSQYMLIWYANIPEETRYYLARQTGGAGAVVGPWAYVSLLLVAGHLLIPFVGLLSRHVKRNRKLLVGWAVWLLVFHWVDMYWLVMPSLGRPGLPFGFTDVFCILGLGGAYVAGTLWIAGDRRWIAVKDPRMSEALVFENT
ncbi:MAG: quinol:cytochrome C oxidoreductase [Planctomycetes bacterium]|nr:quinol:cytochrome C oxidoreductase [Planctomycetota bacterium]